MSKKKSRKRFRIKSIYVKWSIRFVGLILIAQTITFGLAISFILPAISEKLREPHAKEEIFQNINEHGYDANHILILTSGIRDANFIATIIASVFSTIGLFMIIRPIRKVTNATKEVAKGNFDVELKSNSEDEIGQLINNFNSMITELKKIDYLRKDFVSSVSHEFKTPITSIEGFARMLKNTDLTPEQFDEYTDIIIKEAERLSELSSNLLKLSMLEYSDFEPVKTKFSLDEHIRKIILLLQNQWESKNIELDIDMDEAEINSNEELLSQVWINLIQNAIKFSDANGTISIVLKQNVSDISVTVKDNGRGMTLQERERIFERFYKADKSRSEDGNGLGLSIVKKIVEILNGSIDFESELGQGSAFTIILPKT